MTIGGCLAEAAKVCVHTSARLKAKEPENIKFSPQSKNWEETSKYSETGYFKFSVEAKDIIPVEQAAKEVKLFLKDKDLDIAKEWPFEKIEKFIIENLKKDGWKLHKKIGKGYLGIKIYEK